MFTYMNGSCWMVNVGKYTIYLDGMDNAPESIVLVLCKLI